MIFKVGHWYMEDKSTYITVFGATSAPHLLPACAPNLWCWGEYATKPFYKVSMPL
jgi:hypothetical protein